LEHSDPLAMVIDLWALCLQMTEYLESGAGRELFGSQQTWAIAAALELEADIGGVAARVVRPEALPGLTEEVIDWAREHPLQDIYFARTSILSLHAQLMAERPAHLLQTMSTVAGQVADLKGRLALYADQLPRLARWQAELLTEEASERIVAAQLTRALDALREERAIVLQSIERQRLDTLEVLQTERELLLERLREERETLVGQTAELADEVMDKVEALVGSQILSLTNHVQRQRLDTLEFIRSERMALSQDAEHIAVQGVAEIYNRLWLVLAATWFGVAALLVLARRLFRDNRKAGGDTP
jgi:hypothetical protein